MVSGWERRSILQNVRLLNVLSCCEYTVSVADRSLTQALRLLKERSANIASLLRADADFSDLLVHSDINSSINLLDGSAET